MSCIPPAPMIGWGYTQPLEDSLTYHDDIDRDRCAMCPSIAIWNEGINEGLCVDCAANLADAEFTSSRWGSASATDAALVTTERAAAGIDSCCADATFGLGHGPRWGATPFR